MSTQNNSSKATRYSGRPAPSFAPRDWLRTPIKALKGLVLIILIYARYSTDEQNPRSIADQISYCKDFLAACGVTEYKLEVFSDEGMSGELTSRPGIDELRAKIEARAGHVLICEDSSRLFRQETSCGELIETAVDADFRVICINDLVDTADEDWDARLNEAMRHHAQSNRYTSRRIRRSIAALWAMGAAVTALKPGYRRNPTHSATEREPARGPYFDEVDPQWAPVIRAAFERAAAVELPETIGVWLTSTGLPKMGNAKHRSWSDKNVISLIRRTDYRGAEEYNKTVSKKILRTGKRKARRNEPGDVWVREMPHLRLVPDGLWYAANDAIDRRCRHKRLLRGDDHPLAGIPRFSRGPLANNFYCRCKGKMHLDLRYRCEHAKHNHCWNKATAEREVTHANIRQAVVDELLRIKAGADELVAQIQRFIGDRQEVENLAEHHKERKAELLYAIERLTDAIETAEEPPDALVKRLYEREEELARLQATIDSRELIVRVPTVAQIQQRIDELIEQVQPMDRHSQSALRQLLSPIRAIPFRQFASEKVVLRAKFDLKVAAVLPANIIATLVAQHGREALDDFGQVALCVDLFDPSSGPKYGRRALELKEQGLGSKAIARELSITARMAHIAVQYGRKLREAGITDAFIELTEPPPAASRWRKTRRRSQSAV